MNKFKLSALACLAMLFFASNAHSQSAEHRYSFSVGGTINHYNGNLGSSLLQFKTTCFAGVSTSIGIYLNKSFDLNFDNSIGRFGYCPTDEDDQRTAAFNLRCPGESCANFVGMGNLRSQIFSSSVSLKYKFGNRTSESPRVEPYIKAGIGYNYLSDVMKRNCVNEGSHFTVNGGLGLRYNITPRFNVNYNLDVLCFTGKKVYQTEPVEPVETGHDHGEGTGDHHHGVTPATNEEVLAMLRRRDFCMQNGISFGFSF